jgi:uncharacterized protein with HEPN domain
MPPRDARKYLYDIAEAATQLSEFVSGKSLEDYLRASSANLKSWVKLSVSCQS